MDPGHLAIDDFEASTRTVVSLVQVLPHHPSAEVRVVPWDLAALGKGHDGIAAEEGVELHPAILGMALDSRERGGWKAPPTSKCERASIYRK